MGATGGWKQETTVVQMANESVQGRDKWRSTTQKVPEEKERCVYSMLRCKSKRANVERRRNSVAALAIRIDRNARSSLPRGTQFLRRIRLLHRPHAPRPCRSPHALWA